MAPFKSFYKIDNPRGIEILDIAEENGLVHSINNREDPNFLCNCCECCCVFVSAADSALMVVTNQLLN